ncbi:hypothetical protein LCGC14_0365590 [marine sediment metagenome]|uniref:Uncharacterized protein n=1 Tax=marine sediment metagenome TaxID=412755 RepID=A0A0F9WF56_9ZZZZ
MILDANHASVNFLFCGGTGQKWGKHKWLFVPYWKKELRLLNIPSGLKSQVYIPFDCEVVDAFVISEPLGFIDIIITNIRGGFLLHLDSSMNTRTFGQRINKGDILKATVMATSGIYESSVVLKLRTK